MIFGIDIDGTIALGECFTREQALGAVPNTRMIDLVNKLYLQGHAIILYTCRGDSIIPATRCWLKENGVKHHSLNNNKLWCDYYVDDRAIKPDEFISLYEKQIKRNATKKRDRDNKKKCR